MTSSTVRTTPLSISLSEEGKVAQVRLFSSSLESPQERVDEPSKPSPLSLSAFFPVVVFSKLYELINPPGAKGVEKIGLIHTDFSQVDLSQFKSRWNKKLSRLIYEVPIELEVRFGEENGILDFRVISQGKTMGQASIEYNVESGVRRER